MALARVACITTLSITVRLRRSQLSSLVAGSLRYAANTKYAILKMLFMMI